MQTKHDHIPFVPLQTPVEVMQSVLAVLYAGVVGICGLALIRTVLSAGLVDYLSVRALRNGVLQYITHVLDRKPVEVVFCAPLVSLAHLPLTSFQ